MLGFVENESESLVPNFSLCFASKSLGNNFVTIFITEKVSAK